MNIKQAAYDILHRLGQVSDDSTVEYRLALQWLNTARLGSLEDYFKENGEGIPPSMLKRVSCTPLLIEDACDSCPVQYLTLPYDIIDLPNDIGVFSVQRPGGKEIDRYGSPGMAKLLDGGVFSGTGYARVGNRIDFYGPQLPNGINLTLWLVPSDMGQFTNTDPFPAPAGLTDDILDKAEAIGRRKLQLPVDVTNDGSDG